MDRAQFIATFGGIYEHSAWVWSGMGTSTERN